MRKRANQLYARSLGPREGEAFRSLEPGITIAELPDLVGVGMTRMWQIVGPLEASPVHLERGREISSEHTSPSTTEGGHPLSCGGRPAWNPGIVADERRRPARSRSSSDVTSPRAR
jgi:hypothetical protein